MSQFPADTPVTANSDGNNWAMMLHLSQLLNFIVPFAGIIAPILIWQLKKGDYAILDQHGKNVTNWIISSFIYGLVSGLLVFLVIGIFLLIALGIVSVVFAIMGGIKASSGEVWKYPLTIEFLK